MKNKAALSVWAWAFTIGVTLHAQAADPKAPASVAKPLAAAPAPPKPAADSPPKPVSLTAPPQKPKSAEQALEAARKGVVILERANRPLEIGTVLSGDGRILSALSPLTHGNQVEARYPDGRVFPVRISHADRAWDLALLSPQGDAPLAGLRASRNPGPEAGAKLHAFSLVGDKTLAPVELAVRARSMFHGGDSALLGSGIELGAQPKATDVGGPLLDDAGQVVAIVARACAPSDTTSCNLVAYGAPVNALRAFLRSVPERQGGWLGVDGVAYDAGPARGVRVVDVHAQSPALEAGLHGGPEGIADVIVAVDGSPVSSPEALAFALQRHAAGENTRLLLLSRGKFRELSVTLGELPDSSAARRQRTVNTAEAAPKPAAGPGPNPY